MRKILPLACFVLLCNMAHAQYVVIPDNDFRNFLKNRYPTCFNMNEQMDTTCSAVTTEDSLEFHGINSALPFVQPMSLTGIQYFDALQYLDCSNNQITYTGTLPAGLKQLDYSFTAVSPGDGYLPQLPNGLRYLRCSNSYLFSLPAHLPDSLRYLNFSGNSISSISLLPSKIDSLICSNQLGYSPYTHVLRTLPALPATLKYLDCSNNGLNAVPALPASLKYLSCSSQYINTNPETTQRTLAALPALPAGLVYLDCANNYISTLPGLPAALKHLDCSAQYLFINTFPPPPDPYNYTLSLLPTLPVALETLYCNMNMISCMPHLPPTLNTLLYDAERIPCLPNTSIAAPDAVVCNPANDYNQCLPYPVISGTVFTDINSNGLKDANEFPRSNVRLSLSNRVFTFSDINGHFQLKADSIGTNTVSVTAPAYYNAAPSSASFNFGRYDTAVTTTFALQPSATKDSLTIKIIPVNNAARPGFSFPYVISYENSGTTSLSPSISFQYDNTRLVFDSASNVAVTDNGNSLHLQPGILAPGQNGSFAGYFRIKPSAVNGDTLKAKATIAGTVANTDSSSNIIRGSYDPNDKQATAQLTPSQVANGSYIDYLIRFQNTGFDSAFTIVVSDTLSDHLLIHSLQLISSSHPCKVTIMNQAVFFEFKNIRLPDSNVNEVKSHGFVAFRVQASPSTALHTVIDNSAFIYFDYNIPVLTNTAFTVIKNPGQLYVFTGNGNWDDPSGWKDNSVPPTFIQQNEMIIINPAENGSCILNIPVTALPGARMVVQKGKSFVIQGNLIIQQ